MSGGDYIVVCFCAALFVASAVFAYLMHRSLK